MDLRLIVVTDRGLAAPRKVREIVEAALAAGAPAVQLRDKTATARELFEQATALLPRIREYGALLFVNDRLDAALAAGADGAHLGPDDLPVAAARRAAPAGFLIGYSTDDPETARRAVADGAAYIGCGAVFGTTTKAEAGQEGIGTERLDSVARAVDVPVVGIGGITPANVAQVAATAAAGAAVVGAVMAAADPAAAVRALLAPFPDRPRLR
ncbi:MAG: thiamine phosphate synthase [Gemmatimonadota bacterium]